jgi:uncharacterized protein YfiM (DUF2279 family)
MRSFFKLCVPLICVPVLALAGVIYFAVDTSPNIHRAAEITPSEIERAKLIIDQNHPRKLKPGTLRTISVHQSDLDLAANYLAQQYASGGARVRLQRDTLVVDASLKVPISWFPVYLNVDAILAEDGTLPRFESLRIGRLSIPPELAHFLIPHLLALAYGSANVHSLSGVVKEVSIDTDRIALTYEWQADLPDALRTALVSAAEKERLRLYYERLTTVSESIATRKVSLTRLLVPLFALAAERSTDNDPAAENRAAILVLTLYVNNQSLERIVPDARSWPRPTRHRALLNGRTDFPKHFMISAALAAKAGGPLSDAVGVYKEIEDSRHGSGFSFNDIAADRAGTRLGEDAANVESARILQQRLSTLTSESEIMPATADLPEFMPEPEFLRRFGGVDAPEYKKMMAMIEQRVAALPLYR